MVNQIKREDMYDKLGNIDQIRDIIFGSQLREYSTRFEKIETDILALQQELRDRMAETKLALSSEIRVAIESLDKKIKTLQTSSEDERHDLRQQIDRTYRKATSNFEKITNDLEENSSALRDELIESRDKLQEDVRSLRTYIQEELDRRLSALSDIKVSRDDMAEILFELGMRLKGTEFVPELEEASDLILVDRMSTEE